jgi:hypothetical protein
MRRHSMHMSTTNADRQAANTPTTGAVSAIHVATATQGTADHTSTDSDSGVSERGAKQ